MTQCRNQSAVLQSTVYCNRICDNFIFPWKWRIRLILAISSPILIQFFSLFGMLMLKMISMLSYLVWERKILNKLHTYIYRFLLISTQIDAWKFLRKKFVKATSLNEITKELIWRKIFQLEFFIHAHARNQKIVKTVETSSLVPNTCTYIAIF